MHSALRSVSPDQLPHVWRAPDLARDVERVVSTGYRLLDEHLPGGGWPIGCLVEILQGKAGRHVWQLLMPGLASMAQSDGGPLVMVDPPHLPFAPALAAQGLMPGRLLRIQAQQPRSALWASEQALKCADVMAVLAWLPRCKSAELRRLQLAAAQHGKLLFIFRGMEVAGESTAARLRLAVEEHELLKVMLLKRRGPPLSSPLVLATHPQRLQQLLESRRRAPPLRTAPDRSHVLDRTFALA